MGPGERLRREREDQGHKNREAFARLTKTRPSTLAAFEDPKTKTQRSRYLPAWCAPLGLNPLWVETGRGEKYVSAPSAIDNSGIDEVRTELAEVVRSVAVATPAGAKALSERLRALVLARPDFVFARTLLGLIEAEQALHASLHVPTHPARESDAHRRP